ncbi:PCI domain-containing protein [Cardiosporidium cionae]|uniref:PCI domain-containing protein n=1 Tax=Cardiosporidium cionae TaxID=476202 RepID=A0ABQ7J6U6_9APIC|nr:PCI domain-containing protein [Cardiosporidium cionae]|eukprot:KAF8819722.1 PCI domain-containing protein [Cardiosporidium cionae]
MRRALNKFKFLLGWIGNRQDTNDKKLQKNYEEAAQEYKQLLNLLACVSNFEGYEVIMGMFDEIDKLESAATKILENFYELTLSTVSKENNTIHMLKIKLFEQRQDRWKLKEWYSKALSLCSTLPDPRKLADLHKSVGLMHLTEKKYEIAYKHVWLAFLNYQTIGNSVMAKNMLQYITLITIVGNLQENPFLQEETKIFLEDLEIRELLQLLIAYQSTDSVILSLLLESFPKAPFFDELFSNYWQKIKDSIFLKLLEFYLKPYKTLSVASISETLKITTKEATRLLLQFLYKTEKPFVFDEMSGFVEMQANISSPIASSSSSLSLHTICKYWDTNPPPI